MSPSFDTVEPPYHPIIYVRGFAGDQDEVEDTVATPFMGFNLGSTKIRQRASGRVQAHVFESPLIRLMKDHGYVSAYRDGDLLPKGTRPYRSVWIFRYYDLTSEDLGTGKRDKLDDIAWQLRAFILHVRQAVCAPANFASFRVHLVAHSMGGLICRSYLQNNDIPDLNDNFVNTAKDKGVDKLFTYGTPHGGIEARTGLGWFSKSLKWMNVMNSGVFTEKEMRRYLDLPSDEPLQSLNNRFSEDRVFCLIGTNARDYTVSGSSSAMGSLSDGLVKMKNAYVYNPDPADLTRKLYAHRAYVYRSHSGHFGLVNSEEGYQSLQRFLFGNFAVTVSMTVNNPTLPEEVTKFLESETGEKKDVGFLIETDFGVRGLPMHLNSRNVSEESAIFRSFHDIIERPPVLLTTFLMLGGKVDPKRQTLGFSLRLTIRMPEVEVDGVRYNDGYEGSTLFSDRLIVELFHEGNELHAARYGWDQQTPNISPHDLEVKQVDKGLEAFIPLIRDLAPHIEGTLKISARPWNTPPDAAGDDNILNSLAGSGGPGIQRDAGSQFEAGET